jgi:hypothetical protein
MNSLTTRWIYRGEAVSERPQRFADQNDDSLLRHEGFVRLTACGAGTEIKWSVMSPCFSSLFYSAAMLADLPGPYMLRYFLAGWFEESFESAAETVERIHEIIARSDIHLVRRAFVREFNPTEKQMPSLLKDTWIDGAAETDYTVDCVYEESSGRFRVDWIGPKSTIAKLWGLTPVSYPCQAGGSYDRIVSAAYIDVLKSGRPRYDHVYAAMVTPEADVVWIPYHRVIIPRREAGSRRRVSVVSEIAKVDIQIL